MKAMDILYAQNWAEQMKMAHEAHPNVSSGTTMEIIEREGFSAVMLLFVWAETREGWNVWCRRHENFFDRAYLLR